MKACIALVVLGVALSGCGRAGTRVDLANSLTYRSSDARSPDTELTVFAVARLTPSAQTNVSQSAHYALASGVLPSGLQLDPDNGIVSGVPLVPGKYVAHIALLLDGAAVQRTALHLTVRDQRLFYRSSAEAPLELRAGQPITELIAGDLRLAPGVTPHFSVADAASLPKGMKIDPSTGRIEGTPTHTGLFDIKVALTLHYLQHARSYLAVIPCWVRLPGSSSTYGGVRG